MAGPIRAAQNPTGFDTGVSGQVSALASKGSPVAGDYLLIEDSEDSNSKKSITIGDLPSTGLTTHEEAFTATPGVNTFTLVNEPATNTNHPSNLAIIGVFNDGYRNQYNASATLASEWKKGAGGNDEITISGMTGGETVTVIYGTIVAGGGGGGSTLTVEDEGTPLSTAVTKIDFAGAGVTVTEPVTDEMLVTIPGYSSPLTTKGDLLTYDTGDQRLAVGANGTVLTADSAQATGVKWAASSSALSYLPTTQPAGAAAPAGVYQFDKSASDLLDRTANGNDLTLTGGFDFHSACRGLVGRRFDGPTSGTFLERTAAFEFTGAMTVEILFMPVNPGAFILFNTGQAGGGNMYLYLDALVTTLQPRAVHNAGELETAATTSLIANEVVLLTVTRDTTPRYKFFLEGKLLHTGSALGAVTGATGSLRIGRGLDGLLSFDGVLFGIRVTNAEYTDAQVLEAAQQVGLA